MDPSKASRSHATLFESQSTAAWTGIIARELFFELLVAVDDSHASFDLRFRWESASSFTHRLERSGFGRVRIALVCSMLKGSSEKSALARNRTWSTTFAKSRAVRHTPRTWLKVGFATKPSNPPRNRTWSDSFEDCHAIQHTRESYWLLVSFCPLIETACFLRDKNEKSSLKIEPFERLAR